MTAVVMPGVTVREIFWDLPLVTVSYLLVQSFRRAGVKGISRSRDDAALWKRFAQLHAAELEEEKKRKGSLCPTGPTGPTGSD